MYHTIERKNFQQNQINQNSKYGSANILIFYPYIYLFKPRIFQSKCRDFLFSRFLGKTNLLFPHHLNFLDFRHNISLTHSRTDLLAENSCSRTDLLELADEPNTIVANDGKVVVLTSNFIYVCSILCASIHRLQGYIFWPLPTTSPPHTPLREKNF